METDSTALLNDVPENLSDLVPYRCPKCGHLRKFATLRELRLHLQNDHAFQMGFIKPQPPHQQARTNVFQGDTSKQSNMKQHNLFRRKEMGRMNSRSMSTLSSHGSNQHQDSEHDTREDSPLLDSYKAETEILERELLLAKQSELRNKARSMTVLTDSSGNEDYKQTPNSRYDVNDIRSQRRTFSDSKQNSRGSLIDVDIESRNYARALQNDLMGIWKDTDMRLNVQAPIRPIPSSTSGVDLKGKLEAMNSEVIKSRLNHWVTSDALYKSQDMLREMEHAVEENCNEQKGIITNLLKEIQVKDQQLEETRKEHGKLNQERTRLFDETENLVREADTYNRKLQEELRRRGDIVETLNTELETLKGRSEQEIRSKESDLQNVKVKMNHLEWERDKMIGEMESLLQQAEQDGTILRNTIHDKEKELEAVNAELNSLRWNQHQLLERTMEVYKKAEESQDMMKTVLVAKEDQLRSAMEQIDRMKEMQKQLVHESRSMSEQAEENTTSLKKLLQLKEDQVKEAAQQLQFLRKEKASIEDSSVSLAEKAETSMAAIENLKGVVKNKEKELQTAQGELQNLRTYLQLVAERERVARAKLENFIEELITRAEKAETELRVLRSQSSDSRAVPVPGVVQTRTDTQVKPKSRVHDANVSADEITERHSLPKSIPPPKPPRARTSTFRKAETTINDMPVLKDSLKLDQKTDVKRNGISYYNKHDKQTQQHTNTHDGNVLQKLLSYIHRPMDSRATKAKNHDDKAHRQKHESKQHVLQRTIVNTESSALPYPQAQIPVSELNYVNMLGQNLENSHERPPNRHENDQPAFTSGTNNTVPIYKSILDAHDSKVNMGNNTFQEQQYVPINKQTHLIDKVDSENQNRHLSNEIKIPRQYGHNDTETDKVLRALNNIPLKRELHDESLQNRSPPHSRKRSTHTIDATIHPPHHFARIPYTDRYSDQHTDQYAERVDETVPKWRRSIPPVSHRPPGQCKKVVSANDSHWHTQRFSTEPMVYRSRNRNTKTQYHYETDMSDPSDESEYHRVDPRMHRPEYIAPDRRTQERVKQRYYENDHGELVEVPRYRKRNGNYRKQPSRYTTRQNRYMDHDYYDAEPDYYDEAYSRDQPRDYNDDIELTDDAWDEDEFIYIPQHRPRPGTIGKARDSPSIMRPKKIKQRPIKKDKYERFNSNYPTSHKSMTNLLASSEYNGHRDKRERSKRSRSLSPATRQRQEPSLHKEGRNKARTKDISKPTRKEQSRERVLDTRTSDNDSVSSDDPDGYVRLQEEESAMKFEQNMDENGILWEDDTLPDVSDSEFDRVSPSGSEAITTKKACILVPNPADTRIKIGRNAYGRDAIEKDNICSENSDTKRLLSNRSGGSEKLHSSKSSRPGILKTSETRQTETIEFGKRDSDKHLCPSPINNKDTKVGQNKLSTSFRPINPDPKNSSSDMTSGGKEVYTHMRRSPVVNIRGSSESSTPSNSIKDTFSKNSPDSLSLNSGNKHIRESLDEALKRISEKYKAKRGQNTNPDKSSESSSIEDKIKSISNKYAKRRQDIISGKDASNSTTKQHYRSGEINDFLKSRLLGEKSYSRLKAIGNTSEQNSIALNVSAVPHTLQSSAPLDSSKLYTQPNIGQSRLQNVNDPLKQIETPLQYPPEVVYPNTGPYMNYPMHPLYMQQLYPGAPFPPNIAPRPPTYPKQGHTPAKDFAYRFPYFHGYTPPFEKVSNQAKYIGSSVTDSSEVRKPNVNDTDYAQLVNTSESIILNEKTSKVSPEISERVLETPPMANTYSKKENSQGNTSQNDQTIPEYSERKHSIPIQNSSPIVIKCSNSEASIIEGRNGSQTGKQILELSKEKSIDEHTEDLHISDSIIRSDEKSEVQSIATPVLNKSKSIDSRMGVKSKGKLEKAIIRDDTFYYDSDEDTSIQVASEKENDTCTNSKLEQVVTKDNTFSDEKNSLPIVPKKEQLRSETSITNDYSDEEFEMIEDISKAEVLVNYSSPDANMNKSYSLDDFRDQISVEENDITELVNLNEKPIVEETQIESDMNSMTEGFSMFAEPIVDEEAVSNNDFTSNTQSLSDIPEILQNDSAHDNDTDTEMARQTFYEKSEKIKAMIENSESDYSEVYKMKSSRNTMSSASSQASFDIPDKIPWYRREEVKRRRQALRCIFYFLDTATLCRAAQVCREWRIVARSPKLWQRVELRNEKISSKFLTHVARRCSQLKVLILEDLRPRNRKKNETLEEYTESIECSLEAGYEHVLKRSESTLHTVTIINCGKLLSAKCLWAASCYSRMLRHVTYLSDYDPINAEVMWALGSGCRDLKTLQVHPLQQCQRPGNFSTRCVQLIGKCFPDLKKLSIGNVEVDVKALVYIAKQCRKLKYLDLDHMALVPTDVMTDMCEHGLKYLNCIRFIGTPVAPEGLTILQENCHYLDRIYIQMNINDYFKGTKQKENLKVYATEMDKLEALQKKPGLINMLRLKISRLASTSSTEQAPDEEKEEENIVTGFFKKILPF